MSSSSTAVAATTTGYDSNAALIRNSRDSAQLQPTSEREASALAHIVDTAVRDAVEQVRLSLHQDLLQIHLESLANVIIFFYFFVFNYFVLFVLKKKKTKFGKLFFKV